MLLNWIPPSGFSGEEDDLTPSMIKNKVDEPHGNGVGHIQGVPEVWTHR